MSVREFNLDKLAARHSQSLIRSATGDVDSLVTRTLGVLQENGVYACMLYLLSRTQQEERNIAAVVRDEMLQLMEELGFEGWAKPTHSNNSEVILNHISKNITGGSLERLLLVKEILESMLIYARYGAKARDAESPVRRE